MTKLRALLFDPLAQLIVEVTIGEGAQQLPSIYDHIGHEPVDIVRLSIVPHIKNGVPIEPPKGTPASIDLVVDDEGLLRPEEGWPGFVLIEGHPQPIAGRVLLVAHDREGNLVDLPSMLTPSHMRRHVQFPQIEYTHTTTEEKKIDHPIFGPTVAIINTPHFRPRPN